MKPSMPSPPKPGPSSPPGSPSALLPLYQPMVSKLGRLTRMGGPDSQVARARPSWKMMPVLATLIFLMTCVEPGNHDRITKMTVRNTRKMTLYRDESGLTSAAILGKRGVRKRRDAMVDKKMSVKTYWLTNSGWTPSVVLVNVTPLSIPSPSNQCASRPRSSFETGFPPFRTYSPPTSSSGIVPV